MRGQQNIKISDYMMWNGKRMKGRCRERFLGTGLGVRLRGTEEKHEKP